MTGRRFHIIPLVVGGLVFLAFVWAFLYRRTPVSGPSAKADLRNPAIPESKAEPPLSIAPGAHAAPVAHAGAVEVRVVNEAGSGVSGASLSVLLAPPLDRDETTEDVAARLRGGASGRLQSAKAYVGGSGVTDEKGLCLLKILKSPETPASLDIVVDHPGYVDRPIRTTRRLRWPAAREVQRVVFTLEKARALAGRILGASADELKDFSIDAVSGDARTGTAWSGFPKIDARGGFLLSQAPPEALVLRIVDSKGRYQDVEQEVPPGVLDVFASMLPKASGEAAPAARRCRLRIRLVPPDGTPYRLTYTLTVYSLDRSVVAYSATNERDKIGETVLPGGRYLVMAGSRAGGTETVSLWGETALQVPDTGDLPLDLPLGSAGALRIDLQSAHPGPEAAWTVEIWCRVGNDFALFDDERVRFGGSPSWTFQFGGLRPGPVRVRLRPPATEAADRLEDVDIPAGGVTKLSLSLP